VARLSSRSQPVKRISNLPFFEPDKVSVDLHDRRPMLEPGQNVISRGVDRDLTIDEAIPLRLT
jgi:hypothetical protein